MATCTALAEEGLELFFDCYDVGTPLDDPVIRDIPEIGPGH